MVSGETGAVHGGQDMKRFLATCYILTIACSLSANTIGFVYDFDNDIMRVPFIAHLLMAIENEGFEINGFANRGDALFDLVGRTLYRDDETVLGYMIAVAVAVPGVREYPEVFTYFVTDNLQAIVDVGPVIAEDIRASYSAAFR